MEPPKRNPRGMPFATKNGLAQLCILSTRMHRYIYTQQTPQTTVWVSEHTFPGVRL